MMRFGKVAGLFQLAALRGFTGMRIPGSDNRNLALLRLRTLARWPPRLREETSLPVAD
jgi:hypothetical protein